MPDEEESVTLRGRWGQSLQRRAIGHEENDYSRGQRDQGSLVEKVRGKGRYEWRVGSHLDGVIALSR